MRFEFELARKYLLPRRRQLSVSLICLLSVFVITLIVWLLLTFLSVMGGIEKGWLHKLTSLNAPVKVHPKPAYFNSYYYQIDAISSNSDYELKSIGEKRHATLTDPYQPDVDTAVPKDWDNPQKDLVKELFAVIETQDVTAHEFDVSAAMLRLKLIRGHQHSFISQVTYVASYADTSYMRDLVLTNEFDLSPDEKGVSGVLLPRAFRDQGVLIGDHGFLAYGGSGASSGQEMRLNMRVAGFYDPGVMAMGPKCILAPAHIASMLRSAGDAYALDPCQSTGVRVWFPDLSKAQAIKTSLETELQNRGLDTYWSVQSYHDYDFAKDLLQQFQSDKMLFTLIGIIILVVAASNIVSSLILLVSNKKKEIGILQSMGASKKSIVLIFALCGGLIGMISTLIGTLAAYLTLHNIDSIIALLSRLQGHDLFNALFYGSTLPSTLSPDAIAFIAIATPIISLLAGLIPALKAARMQPSAILRSE